MITREDDESQSTPLLPTSENAEIEAGFAEPSKPSGGASFYGSVFNLSCTVIGSGIMSLPATLTILGLIPGVALIVVAAFLTEASIEMLLRFSKPGSVFSYGDLMGEAFGKVGKVLVQICVIVSQGRIHSGVNGVSRPLGSHGNNLREPLELLVRPLGAAGETPWLHTKCSTKGLKEPRMLSAKT